MLKSSLTTTIATILVLTLTSFVVSPVFAQTTTNTNSAATIQDSTTTSSEEVVTDSNTTSSTTTREANRAAAQNTAAERKADLEAQRAAAQLRAEEARANAQSARAEAEQRRDEAVAQRCEVVTQQIDIRIDRYQNNENREQRLYEQLHQLGLELISRAQTQGYDTTGVSTSLDELKALADATMTEWAEFIALLEETKVFACGESDGQFQSSLQTARAQLDSVRAASLKARSYYQDTFRPAVQALREQSPNN